MKVVALLLILIALAVANDRQILGYRTVEPKGWKLGRAAEADTKIAFYLPLKQRNLDVLENKFWAVSDPDSPEYREFLGISEILAIVSPPQEEVDVVVEWLHAHGIENIRNYGDTLFVETNAQTASKLFDTNFHYWKNSNSGRVIVRMAGKFSVPKKIYKLIDFVAGITEFPNARYTAKRTPAPLAPETAVQIAPQSLNAIYSVPAGFVSSGNSSVCVAEFEDQNFTPSDLSQFASLFNLNIPAVTPNHIVGSNDPTNPGVEAELDIQYATAVAPGATAWFWIEDPSAWLYGYSTHLFQTSPAPLINSISYGWSEEDQCEQGIGGTECQNLGVDSQGYVTRVNTEFQKIGLRGISLLAASGDSGANGRTDPDCTDSQLHPAYPAASPYITAVGATQITDQSGIANLPNPPPGCSQFSCASGGTETAVSFAQANFASGGGFSWVAARPSYQNTAVTKYFNSGVQLPPSSYYNGQGRGFPDVAALGSAVIINVQGELQTVGGTSCSSPIFAGLMSLVNGYVNKKSGKPLGFLNPLLYKMATDCPGCYTDITVGDNTCTEDGCSSSCYGFYCTQGWDPVTGLGTPVFSAINQYIRKIILKETDEQ